MGISDDLSENARNPKPKGKTDQALPFTIIHRQRFKAAAFPTRSTRLRRHTDNALE